MVSMVNITSNVILTSLPGNIIVCINRTPTIKNNNKYFLIDLHNNLYKLRGIEIKT